MITPLGAMVLIKEVSEEEKVTKSGLFVTSATSVTDLKRGEILALGRGDRDTKGNIHPIPLEVGDVVFFNEGHATDVIEDGETYKFVNWNHLFGKVE